MTRAQLVFKAEPDGILVRVEDNVQAGDFLEYIPGAWTKVEAGSPLIGQPPGRYRYARIVPKP